MKTKILTRSEILRGYDAVSTLYPFVPSLSHWRAWEYAAYQHYRLDGRILDLGCGDGHYFQLVWPQTDKVIGVDMNPTVAELGRQSGVYREMHNVPAHQIPEEDKSFDHVFANCSLEHMDHIEEVLAEIHRCLKPGGCLLCSVATDRFLHWSVLPNLFAMAGFDSAAATLQKNFIDYHHLINPLSVQGWSESFKRAGLQPLEHIPIMTKHNSIVFLLMDSIWHVKNADGAEIGDAIFPLLSSNANFPVSFRKIFDGLLEMETDWQDCSGAIFRARKPK